MKAHHPDGGTVWRENGTSGHTAMVKSPVRSAAVGIGMTLQGQVVSQEEADSEETRVSSPQSDRR